MCWFCASFINFGGCKYQQQKLRLAHTASQAGVTQITCLHGAQMENCCGCRCTTQYELCWPNSSRACRDSRGRDVFFNVPAYFKSRPMPVLVSTPCCHSVRTVRCQLERGSNVGAKFTVTIVLEAITSVQPEDEFMRKWKKNTGDSLTLEIY